MQSSSLTQAVVGCRASRQGVLEHFGAGHVSESTVRCGLCGRLATEHRESAARPRNDGISRQLLGTFPWSQASPPDTPVGSGSSVYGQSIGSSMTRFDAGVSTPSILSEPGSGSAARLGEPLAIPSSLSSFSSSSSRSSRMVAHPSVSATRPSEHSSGSSVSVVGAGVRPSAVPSSSAAARSVPASAQSSSRSSSGRLPSQSMGRRGVQEQGRRKRQPHGAVSGRARKESRVQAGEEEEHGYSREDYDYDEDPHGDEDEEQEQSAAEEHDSFVDDDEDADAVEGAYDPDVERAARRGAAQLTSAHDDDVDDITAQRMRERAAMAAMEMDINSPLRATHFRQYNFDLPDADTSSWPRRAQWIYLQRACRRVRLKRFYGRDTLFRRSYVARQSDQEGRETDLSDLELPELFSAEAMDRKSRRYKDWARRQRELHAGLYHYLCNNKDVKASRLDVSHYGVDYETIYPAFRSWPASDMKDYLHTRRLSASFMARYEDIYQASKKALEHQVDFQLCLDDDLIGRLVAWLVPSAFHLHEEGEAARRLRESWAHARSLSRYAVALGFGKSLPAFLRAARPTLSTSSPSSPSSLSSSSSSSAETQPSSSSRSGARGGTRQPSSRSRVPDTGSGRQGPASVSPSTSVKSSWSAAGQDQAHSARVTRTVVPARGKQSSPSATRSERQETSGSHDQSDSASPAHARHGGGGQERGGVPDGQEERPEEHQDGALQSDLSPDDDDSRVRQRSPSPELPSDSTGSVSSRSSEESGQEDMWPAERRAAQRSAQPLLLKQAKQRRKEKMLRDHVGLICANHRRVHQEKQRLGEVGPDEEHSYSKDEMAVFQALRRAQDKMGEIDAAVAAWRERQASGGHSPIAIRRPGQPRLSAKALASSAAAAVAAESAADDREEEEEDDDDLPLTIVAERLRRKDRVDPALGSPTSSSSSSSTTSTSSSSSGVSRRVFTTGWSSGLDSEELPSNWPSKQKRMEIKAKRMTVDCIWDKRKPKLPTALMKVARACPHTQQDWTRSRSCREVTLSFADGTSRTDHVCPSCELPLSKHNSSVCCQRSPDNLSPAPYSAKHCGKCGCLLSSHKPLAKAPRSGPASIDEDGSAESAVASVKQEEASGASAEPASEHGGAGAARASEGEGRDGAGQDDGAGGVGHDVTGNPVLRMFRAGSRVHRRNRSRSPSPAGSHRSRSRSDDGDSDGNDDDSDDSRSVASSASSRGSARSYPSSGSSGSSKGSRSSQSVSPSLPSSIDGSSAAAFPSGRSNPAGGAADEGRGTGGVDGQDGVCIQDAAQVGVPQVQGNEAARGS